MSSAHPGKAWGGHGAMPKEGWRGERESTSSHTPTNALYRCVFSACWMREGEKREEALWACSFCSMSLRLIPSTAQTVPEGERRQSLSSSAAIPSSCADPSTEPWMRERKAVMAWWGEGTTRHRSEKGTTSTESRLKAGVMRRARAARPNEKAVHHSFTREECHRTTPGASRRKAVGRRVAAATMRRATAVGSHSSIVTLSAMGRCADSHSMPEVTESFNGWMNCETVCNGSS
mmetsp:Transcript_28605/g.58461  ORF Transcript_28605/g.58461 Transcript_28605/m.58461 type:complete len:233 (-) Transcript_28605:305-1003(-)